MKPAHCLLAGNSERAEKLTVFRNVYPFEPALAVQAGIMADLPAAQGASAVEENDGSRLGLCGHVTHDHLGDIVTLHCCCWEDTFPNAL